MILFIISIQTNYIHLKSTNQNNLYWNLAKLIHFFATHMEELDPSVLLGVSISHGLLKEFQAKLTINNISWPKITTLYQKLNFLKQKILYMNTFNGVFNKLLAHNLILTDIWTNPSNTIYFNRISIPSNHPKISFDSYVDISEIGSPSPNESDFCITELLLNHCQLSTSCAIIMNENNHSTGYHMTHKLLYYILTQRKGCLNYYQKPFHTLATHFCQQIWNEMNLYISVPLDYRLRDLFLEQILLCSFVGFVDFMDVDYVRSILKWQAADGRFVQFNDTYFEPHLNGLAVAYLTVIVNKNSFK